MDNRKLRARGKTDFSSSFHGYEWKQGVDFFPMKRTGSMDDMVRPDPKQGNPNKKITKKEYKELGQSIKKKLSECKKDLKKTTAGDKNLDRAHESIKACLDELEKKCTEWKRSLSNIKQNKPHSAPMDQHDRLRHYSKSSQAQPAPSGENVYHWSNVKQSQQSRRGQTIKADPYDGPPSDITTYNNPTAVQQFPAGNGQQQRTMKEREKSENQRIASQNSWATNYENTYNNRIVGETTRQLEQTETGNPINEISKIVDHDLDQRLKKAEQEKQELDTQIKEKTDMIQDLRSQLKRAQLEKEEVLTRLSEMAGKKLLDNNPAIADLSSAIRPTKVAEMIKECYDNEWTDALEEIISQRTTEVEHVRILLDYFRSSFSFCELSTRRFQTDCARFLYGFPANTNSSRQQDISKDTSDAIRQLQKVSSTQVHHQIQESFLSEFSRRSRSPPGRNLELYLRKCVEVCWYMCVQTPPMAIDCSLKEGDPFDKNIFAMYTRTGNYVDYLVWPCIRLHVDGPLLSKGVAQARAQRTVPQGKSEYNNGRFAEENPYTDITQRPQTKECPNNQHQQLRTEVSTTEIEQKVTGKPNHRVLTDGAGRQKTTIPIGTEGLSRMNQNVLSSKTEDTADFTDTKM